MISIKLIIFTIVPIILACNKPKRTPSPPSSHTAEDTITRLNIHPNNFVEIDTTGITMFPLSMTETVYDKKRYYKDMPDNDNWNILFYNSNSGKYHLLTDKKILIQGFYLSNSDEYSDPPNTHNRYIFYAARTEDYNKDNLITTQDPLYLFATNRSGHDFRQISPPGYDLSDWKYLKRSNKVILTAISDKNQDSLFTNDEEQLVFESSLEPNSTPLRVFSKSFMDSLKLNFGRYWHRIK